MRNAEKIHSEKQAASKMDSIRELVEALNTKDETKGKAAEQAIQEDALEVLIREDWHTQGEISQNKEYTILLCTSGPAVRIIGDLNEHNEPETAYLEHRGWGTLWIEYRKADEAVLIEYARQFYFGE